MATDKRTLLNNIKSELIAQTWTGSSNVVFASNCVVITTYAEVDVVLAALRTPFAIVIPGEFPSDPESGEEPDFLIGTVTIRFGVIIPGETLGENPIMGANRPDSTKSEGAGLTQIEQEVFNAIGRLNTNDGIDIQFRQMGQSEAKIYGDRYIAFQDIRFEAVCTTVDSATEQSLLSTVIQDADQSDATGTLADITDLLFSVTSGTTYAFRFYVIYQSTLTNTGLKVALTFPAVTTFAAEAHIPTSTSGTAAETQGAITQSGDSVQATATPAATTNYVATVEGIITPSASGTLQCQFAAESGATGTITVKAGSSGILQTIV